MNGSRAERIVAGFGAAGRLIDIDADRRVLLPMFLQLIPTAGGERKTGSIVDGSALECARGSEQAGVINKTASAIGLQDQSSLRCHYVCRNSLHQRSFADNGQTHEGQ